MGLSTLFKKIFKKNYVIPTYLLKKETLKLQTAIEKAISDPLTKL